MLNDLLFLLVGVVLTAGTAIFVAAEFSLVALDPAAVAASAGSDPRVESVNRSLHHLSLQLSACQVGITLTTILLGYVAQDPLADMLKGPLHSAGLANVAAAGIAAGAAFVVVNLFSMLFGELVPKNMALANPLGTAAFVGKPLRAFTAVFRPLIVALNAMANALLRRFGIEPAEEMSGARSASELSALVRRSAEAGTLDTSTASLVSRSIDIGSLSAVDVMTDRGRLHVLPETANAADVVDLARRTGHSRFPVVGENIDDVRGIVNLRRAVAVPYERRSDVHVTSGSLMSPAPQVPETMPLVELLAELRIGGQQMALVIDEYGGTAGVVTLEDTIEEIIGEVSDEHDQHSSEARKISDWQWAVSGGMRPDEILRVCGVAIPEDGPWETAGGFIMAQLGRIPVVGDAVSIGSPEITLTVTAMEGRRIETVRIDLGVAL